MVAGIADGNVFSTSGMVTATCTEPCGDAACAAFPITEAEGGQLGRAMAPTMNVWVDSV